MNLNKFEQGKTDYFEIKGVDVGKIKKLRFLLLYFCKILIDFKLFDGFFIRIGHDNKGFNAGFQSILYCYKI